MPMYMVWIHTKVDDKRLPCKMLDGVCEVVQRPENGMV